MSIAEVITRRKAQVIFSLFLVCFVSLAYFSLGFSEQEMMAGSKSLIYKNIKYKVGFASDGTPKIFALAKYNYLSKYAPESGNPLPENDSMVLGYLEAREMMKEKAINGTQSKLNGFFGINTTVEGILKKTGQPIDMFHFLSPSQFSELNGKEGVIFTLLTEKNEPKMFFIYDSGNLPMMPLEAIEGTSELQPPVVDDSGKKICFVLLGYDEAQMMRSEKLFGKAGDRINGFFGNTVEISGIIRKTNTAIDMFHFVSKDCSFR